MKTYLELATAENDKGNESSPLSAFIEVLFTFALFFGHTSLDPQQFQGQLRVKEATLCNPFVLQPDRLLQGSVRIQRERSSPFQKSRVVASDSQLQTTSHRYFAGLTADYYAMSQGNTAKAREVKSLLGKSRLYNPVSEIQFVEDGPRLHSDSHTLLNGHDAKVGTKVRGQNLRDNGFTTFASPSTLFQQLIETRHGVF